MSDLSSPSVLAALLDAQQEHKSLKVYADSNKPPLNSTVLGFDFYQHSILVDGFIPALPKQALNDMSRRPFWVQLKYQDHFLNLFCLVQDSRYDLHTLHIVKVQFTDNQRWFPRIHFDPRMGPELNLHIPYELPLSGHIRNLSVYGASVEFYGSDVREQLLGQERCEGKIRFNDLFDLHMQCDIKQMHFKRKPSCHSQLRVMFPAHTSVSRIQLENFIEAFSDGNNIPALSKKLLYGEVSVV